MKRKALIIIGLLIVITSAIGISYASWLFKSTQNNFNTMGSKCFEVRIIDETEAITINKAYPITDEEGLKETGYTFTIKNTCNTSATYEVNLEDIITEEKRLSGEYIKVSINDGTPEVLTEKEEKTPTIEEADKAYLLTSGSLLPEEEAIYTLKLWMDESTPAIEETMNATFLSKISIEAGYIEENALENELTIEAVSETESINKESETFKISGTSSKYNIIEYSEDKSHWTRVKDVNKTFEIEKTYTQEGTHNFYIKDEVGNIKETTITTSKLDQTKPTIEMEVITEEEKISLNLTLKDGKSGISGYQVTTSEEEPNNWVSISGNETTINYEITSNDTYYIWLKDVAGNITYKTYTSTTIDNQAPELEITNELSEWGMKDKIIIKGTDDVTGISAYSVSKEEGVYEWITVEESSLTFEKEIEIEENGTYYVSIKDGYEHITTKSIVIDKIDNILPVTESLTSDNEWGKTNHIVGMLKDNESGLKGYQITSEETEPKEYIEISGNSYEINYEVNKNGTYYIWVKDQNENIYKTSIEVTKVDSVAPNVEIEYEQSYNSVKVLVNATDESGIKRYKYSINNSEWIISTENFYQFIDLKYGTNEVKVMVEDNVGNVSEEIKKSLFIESEFEVSLFAPNATFESGTILENIVINGGFEGEEYNWSLSNVQITSEKKYAGNKALKFSPNTTSMSSQHLKEMFPTLNHTYYGSVEFFSSTTFSVADNRFEWWFSDKSGIGNMVFGRKNITNNNWVKISSYQKVVNNELLNNQWQLRNFTVSANENSYADNVIIFDVSKSFGMGKEPDKNWLEERINWFSDTASLYVGKVYSGKENQIKININSGYTFKSVSCSNANVSVTGGNVVITNVSGNPICNLEITDSSVPNITFSTNGSSGTNNWYTSLNVVNNLTDVGSGIAKAKYCVTTGSSCTPTSVATINNNSFNVSLANNASAQKVCSEAIDKYGNSSGIKCSNAYKVDTTNPTANFTLSGSGSSVTINASSSTDSGSGLNRYYYSKDNQNWYESTSNTYTFVNVSPGNNNFYVKVKDNSGRMSSIVQKTYSVKYTYQISYGHCGIVPSNGSYSVSGNTITLVSQHNKTECSDGSVSVRFKIPNLNLVNPTVSFTYTLTSSSGSTAADMYVHYNGITQLDKVYASSSARNYSYTYNGTVNEIIIECSSHKTTKSTLTVTNLKINGVLVNF